MTNYTIKAQLAPIITLVEADTRDEAKAIFTADYLNGDYKADLSSIECTVSHESHMPSYEAGVIASRIHPDSLTCCVTFEDTGFEADESLHYLVTTMEGFVEEHFLEGFVAEAYDEAISEQEIMENARLVLKAILS